jgi:hypothetical protein
MKAMKFRVNSPQHSEQIQQALFDAGYAWVGIKTDFVHTDAKFLFAAGFGSNDNCITYEMDDEQYFKEHKIEEYLLVDGNFIKVGEQFKNMKILVADVFGGMRTQVANLLHNLGYKFCGDPEVYNSAKGFFTYDSGIIMKTDDMEYFKNHPNEEYVMVGDELKKASEWFVSPATPFKQPATKSDVAEEAFAAKHLPPDINWKIPLFTVKTDEQIIAEQKVVADKVLDKLFPIDPFAICAGGAPRDWHFSKPATDLDIFFYTSVEQLTIVAEMLRHVGFDINVEQSADNLPEWYKLNPSLLCVYPAVVDGVNVQLMLMNDKTHKSVVPHFPFSICKAWYKRGHITLEKDFIAAAQNKVVVKCNTVYNDEHKYVQKIKAKFPDWKFCDSWEEAYKHAFYSKGK